MKEPKIRFKGFTGEWETAPLDECVEFLDNLRKPIDEGSRIKGIYPYYGASGIVDYIHDYIFDEELILLSEDGANITDRNYPVCFLASGKYWVNNHAHVLRTKEDFVNNFVCNAMERMDYSLYNTGMAMPKLNKEVCKRIPLSYPVKGEQQAIADYFQNIGSLIHSVTKKIESLKQVKAASLQSMFPQEGETTPRVRFKGFEDEWETVALGTVGAFSANGVDKLIRPEEKMINLLNYLDVYNSRHITKDNCTSLMQVSASDRQIRECDVKKNDIFFTPSSETVQDIGHVLVANEDMPNTCYSYHLMRFRPNEGVFFEDFPNYGFMTSFVRNQMKVLAKGVQRFVIGKPEFDSIKVQIPSYEEQEKIAKYFRSLDCEISALYQRLEKLQQIKSACLDKMFV